DGTMELYEYATDNGHYHTNTVWSGQPNSTRTAIVDGTKTITATGPVGQMLWRAVVDVGSGITTSYETYSDYDAWNRPQKVTYLDGTYDYTVYSSCCGLQTVTNREGTVTAYTYDDQKRLSTVTKNGITTTRNYDAAGNVLSTTRTGTNGNTITLSSAGYDWAGRMLASTNAVGGPTSISQTVY